ncbi:sigma-70 family RNA polymerase sigma factor [Virgibacillus halodenitrificans]|uniref:Sigma-70 family RNA polymerase sigma factor n=1 Tax=Virgibacillus halodenitrificans TaxID=1482 RepID=A0ABR7VPI2_VIRHA|nr:sigma-70 family RNA polymerase sigma factor [Virgibacillus halodenitrificans]
MKIIKKLVKKAQKGNDKSFLKLFQQYEEEVYRTAFIYVKNQHDALDIVQETAYKAFKNIGTLKNPEYIKSWVIRIAISCAIDLIRKNKKVVNIHPQYTEFIGIEDEDIPLSVSLKDLLNVLNEADKNIVLMKYYFGYTFQEIAEMEGIPLGTVKSNLYRALEKLHKQVRRDDFYEQ